MWEGYKNKTFEEYLVWISWQSEVLFGIKDFPNNITMMEKMINKNSLLALQAWYNNVFHMVVQEVIVWIPSVMSEVNLFIMELQGTTHKANPKQMG